MTSLTSRIKQFSEYPLVTLCIGGNCDLYLFCPALNHILQYERAAIDSGEVWRLVSAHLTHWNFDHFLWCTIVFVALGTVCEQACRKGYLVTLVASGLLIPVFTWYLTPEMHTYRGLSSLGSSIFCFGAVWILLDSLSRREWPIFFLAVFAGLAFMAKVIFEYTNGVTLFVEAQQLFTPVPLVHFVGGAIGLLTALLFWRNAGSGDEGVIILDG